jgi:hypothetical protein
MKRLVLPVMFILALLTSGIAGAESGNVLIENLIENSRIFDGKRVTFQGEVIGVMIRENSAWVNVLDSGFAIGVWCSAENAKVSFIGDYTHVGDTVLVSGIFHTACSEHGGDVDIHADNFTILSVGRVVERMPSPLAVVVSVVLMAFAIFLIFWLRHLRKERGKIVPWPMSWR